jgi:ribosomal-protein-alanine N-acetyltransferase
VDKYLSSISIKPMVTGDLKEVLEIERKAFISPWNEEQFLIEILNKDYSYFWVAKDEESKKILGYIGFWLIEDTVHIVNLAVSDEFRRRGIASLLLEKVITFCKERKIPKIITLEVRRSNYKAINLYKKFNFKVVGIRKNYYSDTHDDALIMRLKLK